MAGQPRARAMKDGLEARTRATFLDDDEVHTHLDYIDDWQSGGKTLKALAEELSTPELLVTAEMLTRYLNKHFGAGEVETRLTRARARGAHRLSDEALAIADAVKAKDDVPAARLQVVTRQWTAEKWNREDFGQQNGVNVSIDIGQLHLRALQAVNREGLSGRHEVTGGVWGAISGPSDGQGALAQPIAIQSVMPSTEPSSSSTSD